MVDVPLGTLIFRAGLLAEQQLEEALQEGMRTGKRLGEVLIERGWLNERDLGRMLAGQKGLPFLEVSADDAQHEALQALPEETARRQVALPLRYDDGELIVAVGDPSNQLVLENLRRSLESSFRLVVAPHGELLRAICEAYSRPAPEPTPEPEAEAQPEQTLEPEAQPEPEPEAQPEPSAEPPAQPEASVEPQLQAQPAPDPEPESQPLLLLEPPTLPKVLVPAEPPAAAQVIAQPAQAPAPEEAAVEEPVATPEPDLMAASPEQQSEPEAPLSTAEPSVDVAEAQPETPEPSTPVALEQPEAPLESEPAPAPAETEPQLAEDADASTHLVLVRLRDGETLQVGTFQTAAEASAWALNAVAQIASALTEATWPFFGGRYLRPDTIVSVDLLEESTDN
jgi:hypothetical protein